MNLDLDLKVVGRQGNGKGGGGGGEKSCEITFLDTSRTSLPKADIIQCVEYFC